MTDHIFAYARVSTKEQREDRQLDALTALHIDPRHIYVDKQSGKDFDRPMYRKLLRRLKKDDLSKYCPPSVFQQFTEKCAEKLQDN